MAGAPLSTAFCDALARFGFGDGEEPSKKGTGGTPGISKPNVRAPGVAGAADDAAFDGAGIAAAESAWPEAA